MRKSFNITSIITGVLLLSTVAVAADFGAYYTRLNYEDKITGKYADVVVELNENRRIEFSRESSYLPYWKTENGKWYVDEVIPRSGDGTKLQPDKYNRYSYVRIIENTPDKVVIHWRYFPDFMHVEMTDVVHEYFTITPDSKVTRKVKKGTKKIDDWHSPENVSVQVLQFKRDGIEELFFKQAKISKRVGKAAKASPLRRNNIGEPAAWWTFDEGMKTNSDFTQESISGIDCPIGGPKSYWIRGVSGTALQFDGYTSSVSLPVQYAPRVAGEMTIEAWVAMAAHPFGWVPIIHQAKWGRNGFYLGVNAYGKIGFMANIGREWRSILTDDKLELNRWTHLAVTVNSDTGKVALYIDGEKSAEKTFEGEAIPLANAPLVMGLNSDPLIPLPRERYRYGHKTCITGFEGAIDEVRIHNGVLSPGKLKKSYSNLKPDASLLNNPGFEKRILPGYPGRAEKFGAFYTKLKYHELWDNLWRTSDYPDIVVKFDESPASVVFWRGPSYGPGWVTENNLWMTDQSVEVGNSVSFGEHMSDKQGRYTHVRLIENTDARVVVHWRYNVCDIMYGFHEGFGDAGLWVDEYFSIYPDGVGVRKVNQRSQSYTERPPEKISWQDVQFLAQPGMTPDDVMNLQALDVANLKGETAKMDWTNGIPRKNPLPSANIELINFRSDYKVFLAFQEGTFINPWGGIGRDAYCHFMVWNHWPVAFIACQGKGSLFPDRVTHSALAAADNAIDHGNMAMYGFTDKPISTLVPLARSWCNPPSVSDTEGFKSDGYDKEQRAYIFSNKNRDKPLMLEFKLNATTDSPIVNPALVIKGWGKKDAELKINGRTIKRGKDFRFGHCRTSEGLDLIVWLKVQSTKLMEISLSSVAD